MTKTTQILAAAFCGLMTVPLMAATFADPNCNPPQLVPASGKFSPDWKSLEQYQTPEWFRDAKFGIWAHWSAQCVPEKGDWYGARLYVSNDPKTGKPDGDYTYHVATYGHPSKFGMKDIDNLWHAENWDPEKLIALYKKAGAKYFVALANHHDNFDCYDSTYQPWNSVKIGPKKDIVGGWAKAARAAGLRFGVSVHASHAWMFFEKAQGCDATGPLAGVPYDGNLTKADGKGQWWEGLDPQDLYAQRHKPGSGDWVWDVKKGSSIPDKAYCDKFYNRTIDLIDKYKPDLLYFDDVKLPLWPISDVGLKLAAHYYNANMAWHDGKNEAVLNGKGLNEDEQKCMVRDIEAGKSDRIESSAWQTDTCIGHYHYNRDLFTYHNYRKAAQMIPMLVDIVSKNGNLLLSIPVRGDGTLDSDEMKFLDEMTKWMAVNQECIFATRPWAICGEGPSLTADNGKGYLEGQADVAKTPYTPQDIRFTTSKNGKTLYAIALGWPADGKLVIKSLADKSVHYPGEIGSVTLLGSPDTIGFTRDAAGLSITLPALKPCEYAFALKIIGKE
jgi:alpha-L-fucosidase